MRALNLINAYTSLAYPSTISTATGAITVTITTGAVTGTTHKLVLGDTVTFDAANTPSGQTNAAPPAPLVAGVEYWVIPSSTTSFKLATSYANAVAGIYIVVTGTTATTAAYTVNHYALFTNSEFSNGKSPYLPLVDSQIVDPVYINGEVINYAFTSTSASPAVYTTAAPSGVTWVNGQAVKLGGAVIGGSNFNKNTVYYVVAESTDTFELALTPGGAAINGDGSTTGAGYVYLVNASDVGNAGHDGVTDDVGLAPGSPFFATSIAVLAAEAQFLANNFTTVYIEGADESSVPGLGNPYGTPDLPGAWTTLATLTSAGAITLVPAFSEVTLPAYIRVRVNVLTDFSGGGSGGGLGIVASQITATLLGN